MARPRNDLVERRKVLELLDVEIEALREGRRISKRFSTSWHRCVAALTILDDRRKAVAAMSGWTALQTRKGAT